MSFDLQPSLGGELVELRLLAPEDWDGLFAVGSDPLICEQHPGTVKCLKRTTARNIAYQLRCRLSGRRGLLIRFQPVHFHQLTGLQSGNR
jgi:hypothetical protein